MVDSRAQVVCVRVCVSGVEEQTAIREQVLTEALDGLEGAIILEAWEEKPLVFRVVCLTFFQLCLPRSRARIGNVHEPRHSFWWWSLAQLKGAPETVFRRKKPKDETNGSSEVKMN
eukprot:610082-Amphidinium_carterae.1